MRIRSDTTIRTIEIQDDRDADIDLDAARDLADQKLGVEGRRRFTFVEAYHARYNRAVVVYEY